MKVLVVSLLRLGDVILTLPVARGLKEEFADTEVHYLVNDDLAAVCDLMTDVDRVHFFPRKKVQNFVRDCSLPAFLPWQHLERFFRRINSENFDRVINLTHTKLSQYVVSQIEAEDYQGAHTSASGVPAFGSPWFRLLDQWSLDNGSTEFHYADVFFHGSGLRGGSRRSLLRETEAARVEVKPLLAGTAPLICVQALTSDEKKNWGVEKFGETVRLLSQALPNYRYLFLCAPSEAHLIQPVIDQLKQESGAKVDLANVSLGGLVSVLKKSRMLITGDTGVKHIAAAVGCQVLELSMGSSSLTRTGALLEGSLILQSNESCTPCRHSESCHRTEHFCSSGFNPADVAQIAFWSATGARSELRTIAHTQRGRFFVYEVVRTSQGDWMPRFLGQDFLYHSLVYQLHQCSWKAFAQAEGSPGPQRLSHFVYDLRKEIDLSQSSERSSEFIFQRILSDLRRLGAKMKLLRTKVFWAIRHGQSLETTLEEIAKENPPLQCYARRFNEWKANVQVGEFVKLRRMIDLCEEVIFRTETETKILEMTIQATHIDLDGRLQEGVSL